MAEFMAHYERKLSDGNYGSEGLPLSWTWDIDTEGELPSESVELTFDMLRTLVLTQLGKSQARQVAWAAKHELEPPLAKEAKDPAEAVTDAEDLPF